MTKAESNSGLAACLVGAGYPLPAPSASSRPLTGWFGAVGCLSQQVIVSREGEFTEGIIILPVFHTCLHHSILWPVGGLFMHPGIHGPRVAFAAAPKQIKVLVSLLFRLCGLFRPYIFPVALKALDLNS